MVEGNKLLGGIYLKAVGTINYFLMMSLIAMTWLKYLTVSFPVLHHILLL
jgi:hypothetical protein